jgi:DNA-binding response OmpR family regulator
MRNADLEKPNQLELANGPEACPRQPGCGVLVVDDQVYVRAMLDLALRQEGFTVWLAADGQEAFDLYCRHREAIDVIMLDVRMPGQDGPKTLASLRQLDPQVCCCFMTGDCGDHSEMELWDLEAAAIFHKPFRLAEVAQVLWQLARRVPLSLKP